MKEWATITRATKPQPTSGRKENLKNSEALQCQGDAFPVHMRKASSLGRTKGKKNRYVKREKSKN